MSWVYCLLSILSLMLSTGISLWVVMKIEKSITDHHDKEMYKILDESRKMVDDIFNKHR